MINLRFVSHPGPFTVAVRFAQYGFWPSHCEAVLPDGQRLGSWFLHGGGVRVLPPNYDVGGFSREIFVSVKATAEEESSFYAWLHSQIGKPYDWRAIISFYSKMSGRNWQATDSYFCSELIAAGLAACGIFPPHLAVGFGRITPRDLLFLTSTLSEAR